jgi:hypothetical protein
LDPSKLDDHERFYFLVLLEKNSPGHIFCEHCAKLHAIANALYHHRSKRPYVMDTSSDSYWRHPALRDKTRKWLQCLIADGKDITHLRLHPDFSSTIFRMAMKQYHQGQDCSKLLKLLSCEPDPQHYHARQYTGTPRIVDGRMLWRDQQVDMTRAKREVWIEARQGAKLHICPHLIFGSMESWLEFKDTSQDLQRCKYCYTEFRIDFNTFENRSARFITKWKDFGEGHSVDDRKWRSHLSTIPDEVNFKPGSIFEAFQQDEKEEFDFLLLLDPGNKQSMLRHPC